MAGTSLQARLYESRIRGLQIEESKKLEKISNDLYNAAYKKVASQKKWQNKDFNRKFDNEVEDEYEKHVKLHLKSFPKHKDFFYPESISHSDESLISESQGQLYVVIGIKDNLYQDTVGSSFSKHPSEEHVALFTSEKLAKAWIKKNRINRPKKEFGGETLPFNKKGLLRHYNDAFVQPYNTPLPLPLDPK